MTITATVSNHAKFMMATKKIDLENDSLKAILMNTAFAFDKDAHATLADITASQLSTGNGYTQNDKALANVAVAEDDANDRAQLTCDDPSWTASGGVIGPFGALIIYDDTTTDDTVLGCLDFGTDISVADGTSFAVRDIVFNLS